jgi:hypothetical protein
MISIYNIDENNNKKIKNKKINIINKNNKIKDKNEYDIIICNTDIKINEKQLSAGISRDRNQRLLAHIQGEPR